MLSYEDPKWKQMEGGYRVLYDPIPCLKQLEAGEDQTGVWSEFWNELHHQGDVGEASYAALVELVRIQKERSDLDWNFYALAATIEIQRNAKRNPPVPAWLTPSYDAAWRDMLALAQRDLTLTSDPDAVECILSAIALCKGLVQLGKMMSLFNDSEIGDLLDKYYYSAS